MIAAPTPTIGSLVRQLAAGERSASELVDETFDRIDRIDPQLNAFTDVRRKEARAEAAAVDRRRANGEPQPPLAGIPFGVKNLFDIGGLTTRAGSKIGRENPPATRDAAAVATLRAAGAIAVGTLNMDEYAYGFVTINAHDGATHNPYDLERVAGGSSGGAAAAVGAELVPFALGSDTNGSVRVPASLCGCFGLKPTIGRISTAGAVPLAETLDHVGWFTRTAGDAATIFDAFVAPEPSTVPQSRFAVAGGYFARGCEGEVLETVERVAAALRATPIEIPEAAEARGAAFIITASEAGSFHLERLRTRYADFDPATRDRLLTGTLLPAAWYVRAQRMRRRFRAALAAIFRSIDVLVAPAAPYVAPPIGEQSRVVDGLAVPVRQHLGIYTTPFSFAGYPVIAIPVLRSAGLPIGVQLVGRPGEERRLLQTAARLERDGVAGYVPPAISRSNG